MRHEGIRPSVLAIAALIALGCALACYEAFVFDPLEHDPSAELDEPGDHQRASRGSRTSRQTQGPRHPRHPRTSSRASGDYAHHDWNRETELARGMALGLPGPTFWRDARERGIPENDPQMAAMWRSFHYLSTDDGAPPLPFEPQAHRAELIASEGDIASSATNCQVRVLPVRSGRFNCVIRVLCDGEVLYPNQNQTAGYVPCEIGEDGRAIRAVDNGHTASDGDPLVDLDLANGTITIQELDENGQQRYRATLRISS